MNFIKQSWLCMSLLSAVLLVGCNEEQPPTTADKTPPSLTKNMPQFAASPQDAEDIAQLKNLDARISQISDAMEDRLVLLQQQNQLTPELAYQHKRENIENILNMLKALTLKSDQGQHIQSLMQQYWSKQAEVYRQTPQVTDDETDSEMAMQGFEEFIQAQEQLQHWQEQQENKS